MTAAPAIAAAASSLAAAEERATAAVAELARVEARVTAARGRVDEQQVLVDERAVSAYVDAGSAGLETMFTSTDANEFAERTLMLERVAEHDQAVLSRLEELKGALEREEHAAEGARAGALAHSGSGVAERRTREVLANALGGEAVESVRADMSRIDGVPVVRVSITARVPIIGLSGPASMTVEGHAMAEQP